MRHIYPRSGSIYILRFARFQRLVLSLCALCVLGGSASAQDYKKVHDGIEHAQVDHKIGTDPAKINLLRLDLTKVRLDVHHAFDKAIGVETTSSIAQRKGAVAAINAGFFRLDNSIFVGDAAGVLQVDGWLLSESNPNRIALFINNNREHTVVEFDYLDKYSYYKFKKRRLDVDGSNRERKENEFIEYTAVFNRTTLTPPNGIEIIVKNRKIVEIIDGIGSSIIPQGGYVLSASGSRRDQILKWIADGWIRVGMKINGFSAVNMGDVTLNRRVPYYFEDITNGVPQLIKNGKIDITWEREKSSKAFVETRHPRTAVAKMKDGKFLMITVDGRQPGVSVGMNLNELAEYLLSLGAVDAMNLDGGGSTTMFLDGKVVNKPSDKEGERKVGDAILVTPRTMQKPAR